MNVVSLTAFRNKKNNEPLPFVSATGAGGDRNLVERIERLRSSIGRINALMAELKGDKK